MARKPFAIEVDGDTYWLLPLSLHDLRVVEEMADHYEALEYVTLRCSCDADGSLNMTLEGLKDLDLVVQVQLVQALTARATAVVNIGPLAGLPSPLPSDAE